MEHRKNPPMHRANPTSGADGRPKSLWRDSWNEVQVGFFGRLEGEVSKEASSETWQDHLPEEVVVSCLEQVHGASVRSGAPGCVGQGDALITAQKGLALTVVTADCVPILLASRQQVAAVHAGWRGVVADIVSAALERFEGADPTVAWIGPAIGGCCYEVGEAVAKQVAEVSAQSVVLPREPRPHVDLAAAVEMQLRAHGVSDVRVSPQCTQCGADAWWSYRQLGSAAGRNVAAIWRA